MPLKRGTSQATMSHNISEMMHAGHPQKQSIAAAYAMKRRSAKKMARGGFPDDGESGSRVHPDSVSEQEAAIQALEALRLGRHEASNAEHEVHDEAEVDYAHGGTAHKPKLGSGKRFAHLEHELAHKPGIHDPAAVAASIGRKKYGAEKMAKLSAHGKAHHYDDGGEIEAEAAGASGASGSMDTRTQDRMNERQAQKQQLVNQNAANKPRPQGPLEERVNKRETEREQESEETGSMIHEYADGGMIDTMNEKLHPYHQPMHERSLVQRMMRKRDGSMLDMSMIAHGGEIEDSDLNNATPEEAYVHDDANFEVEESEEERRSRKHEGLRRILKY